MFLKDQPFSKMAPPTAKSWNRHCLRVASIHSQGVFPLKIVGLDIELLCRSKVKHYAVGRFFYCILRALLLLVAGRCRDRGEAEGRWINDTRRYRQMRWSKRRQPIGLLRETRQLGR